MKLVIGLVGPQLAGKETIADAIAASFKHDGHSVSRHRFSDILRETLTLWGMPHGRENEQILAQVMQRPGAFPEGVLSRAVKHRLLEHPTDVGILDGVRWYSDETMLREFPAAGVKNIIIYVTASEDTRYDRLRARNRAGEALTTRAEFTKRNQAENEIYIADIGSRADITFLNDHSSIADFEKEIKAVYEKSIKPLLTS